MVLSTRTRTPQASFLCSRVRRFIDVEEFRLIFPTDELARALTTGHLSYSAVYPG
jgi:hypothetical protein